MMPLAPIASRLADERSARIFAFFRRHHKTAHTAAGAFANAQPRAVHCAAARALIENTDIAI
jgi:hypothetical protein